MLRAIGVVALCVVIAGCPRPATPFLEPVNAGDDAQLRRDGIPVRVDLKQLGKSATLVIAPQLPVVVQGKIVERRGPDDYSWSGKIGADGSAVFTVHGSQVTGVLRTGPDVYDIVALPDGGHKLIRVIHPSDMKDHSPRFKTTEGKQATRPPPRPAGSPTPVIEVLVAYTKAVSDLRADIAAVAQTAITEANQINLDSGADFKLHLAGTIETGDEENPDLDTNLDALTTSKDDYFDDVQGARTEKRADVVVLAIKLQGPVFGTSAAIMADAPTGFAVVNYRYLVTDFVLLHEVGHLLGLRHEITSDDSKDPYNDGHGYRRVDGTKVLATVMATGCVSPCRRVPRWSNPDRDFEGGKGGVKGESNEAGVVTDSAYAVSRFNP